MDSDLRYAIKILKKYHQEHLLNFFDDLNDKEKKELISQINSTDFEKINKLYENSKLDDSIDYKRITPIKTWSKANLESSYINSAIEEGKKIISNNKLAIITLAGGQGTRLGYKGPKGSYEIDVPPKKSLFEFVCDNLKRANETYGCILDWFIMTSPSNNIQTKDFFRSKNFFGYPEDKIKFFLQDTLPLIDINAKVILDSPFKIKTGPNGNGDVFKSFEKAGFLSYLKKSNIDWIFIGGIDNIILEWVDPLFIGLTALSRFCCWKQIYT